LNADFGLSNGSAIQVLASSSEDELLRWFDNDGSDAMAVVANMMGVLSVTGVNSMANPNSIEETYAEVRWVSPADNDLRMVFGASVFDYDSLTNIFNQYAGVLLGLEDEINGGEPFAPINILSDSSTNSGIFANVTYDFTDRTTAAVELRYQEDDITNVNNTSGESFSNVTESWQPRLSINHQLNDEWSAYGQVSSGTNAAGVNIPFTLDAVRQSLAAAAAAGAVQFDDTTFLNFDEERITSYEVGIKGATADRKLRLAASLYVMDWEDMVQPLNLAWNGAWNDGTFDPNGTVFNMADTMARTFLNTGDGDLWGVEVEANWAATESLSLRGAVTYAQAEFANSCDPLAVTNLGLPATDLISEGAATNCVDVSGNDIPGQPDVTAALTGTYVGNIGRGWDWLGRVDLRYQSSEYVDAVNILELPAFTQINASVSFRNELFDIRLFVNNLTDEDTPQTVEFIADNNQLGSPDNFSIRPRNPREVGLRVNVGFGRN
ncbi:MAG: TonB-dependent receptor, partial [Pseudomonadota bacterium]